MRRTFNGDELRSKIRKVAAAGTDMRKQLDDEIVSKYEKRIIGLVIKFTLEVRRKVSLEREMLKRISLVRFEQWNLRQGLKSEQPSNENQKERWNLPRDSASEWPFFWRFGAYFFARRLD